MTQINHDGGAHHAGEIALCQHWIVDEDGNDVGLRFERTDPIGVDIWRGDNGRIFSLGDDKTDARGLLWDALEEAYEVTGEFDVHPSPFSSLDPHADEPGPSI